MPKEHRQHRTLSLFDEAIRRDVHFMASHPTTMFQCMWNTCWWYDATASKEYYEESTTTQPWKRSDAKISKLLELWRTNKEAKASFIWIQGLSVRRRLRLGLVNFFQSGVTEVQSSQSPTLPMGGCSLVAERTNRQSVGRRHRPRTYPVCWTRSRRIGRGAKRAILTCIRSWILSRQLGSFVQSE